MNIRYRSRGPDGRIAVGLCLSASVARRLLDLADKAGLPASDVVDLALARGLPRAAEERVRDRVSESKP